MSDRKTPKAVRKELKSAGVELVDTACDTVVDESEVVGLEEEGRPGANENGNPAAGQVAEVAGSASGQVDAGESVAVNEGAEGQVVVQEERDSEAAPAVRRNTRRNIDLDALLEESEALEFKHGSEPGKLYVTKVTSEKFYQESVVNGVRTLETVTVWRCKYCLSALQCGNRMYGKDFNAHLASCQQYQMRLLRRQEGLQVGPLLYAAQQPDQHQEGNVAEILNRFRDDIDRLMRRDLLRQGQWKEHQANFKDIFEGYLPQFYQQIMELKEKKDSAPLPVSPILSSSVIVPRVAETPRPVLVPGSSPQAQGAENPEEGDRDDIVQQHSQGEVQLVAQDEGVAPEAVPNEVAVVEPYNPEQLNESAVERMGAFGGGWSFVQNGGNEEEEEKED